MKDYIEREYFKKIVDYYLANSNGAERYGYNIIKGELITAPAADVVEVVHGHWIIDKSFMPFISTCSECGATYDIDGAFDWKFCPICGARMDGATNYEF